MKIKLSERNELGRSSFGVGRSLLNGLCFLAASVPMFLQVTAAESVIDLEVLGTYHSGEFDESAAEIVSYDPDTQRLFVVNANSAKIDVLDASDPSNPTLIASHAFSGGVVNSVSAKNGVIAVAVENENKQAAGTVVLMDADGSIFKILPTGSLPDALAFSNDGTKVVVANEGEPNDEYTVDPEGSVTIIDLLVDGVVDPSNATVTQVSFADFNDRVESLRNKGVRITGPEGTTVAQDLEPEYVAISADNETAYVALQENNAMAIIDIVEGTLVDILPLGAKDHSRGFATLDEYVFQEADLPVLGTSTEDDTTPVLLGGMSGLWHEQSESSETELVFYAVPDRGPNGTSFKVDGVTNREFLIPDYQARAVRFKLDRPSGALSVTDQILFTRKDGVTPISGLPNIPGYDEVPLNGKSEAVDYDPYGADMEGIVINPTDGTFWTVDEYRPAIYHFAKNGTLIERYVPEGTSLLGTTAQAADFYGAETLPAEYSKRRANRGFEAVALDTDSNILYTFIQTPMYHPDSSTKDASDVIRILGIDPANGMPVAEYVYLLERNALSGHCFARVDKIGDAVYAGDGRFYILERDSSDSNDGINGHKYIFEFDLKGATNLMDTSAPALIEDKTLEQHSAADLAAQGIKPVYKMKVTNLPSIGYLPSDKPEGLTLLEDGSMALISDNDFTQGGFSDVSLGIISFPEGKNQLDASNKDDEINIANWPVSGLFMPDTIASYPFGGVDYIVTANEGDGRDYDGYGDEERVKDLTLDPDVFPNAEWLQESENLGRLKTPVTEGDIDGDGDHDRIFSFGTRSFSIFDTYGNLVFDSGDDFEKQIAMALPEYFNTSNDETGFDDRSDDKGPEPEALTLGSIDGRMYAFIGMERFGGIFVYDITNPQKVNYVTYVINRDFEADPESEAAGDLGPEGMVFIQAADSPTGKPILVVASEVSGTTTLHDLSDLIVTAPTSIVVSRGEGKEVEIQWTDSIEGEDGFVIERSEVGVDKWMEIARVSSDVSMYIDEGAKSSSIYNYRVLTLKGGLYSGPATTSEPFVSKHDAGTVFLGTFDGGSDAGEFGFFVRENGTGVFVGYDPVNKASVFNLNVEIGDNGSFGFSPQTSFLASVSGPSVSNTAEIAGTAAGGQITGSISGIGSSPIEFSGTIAEKTGDSQELAGFYQGVLSESENGVVYQIIAPDGRGFFYVADGDFADGGIGVAGSDGSVMAETSSGTVFDLMSDGDTGLISGSVRNESVFVASVIGFEEGAGGDEQLVNNSGRGMVGSGGASVIQGFVVEGTEKVKMLIRGAGPALTGQGVDGALLDPVVELYYGQTKLAENDDWSTYPNVSDALEATQSVGAFPFDSESKDANLLVYLDPGAYTVHLKGANSESGIGLLELYNATEESTDAQIVNYSSRGDVETEDGVMIMGFVIDGEIPQKVLVRAAGPSLSDVSDALVDPQISVFSGQTVVGSNDNWSDHPNDVAAAAASVGAAAFEAGSKDSALVMWLEPGAYTAIVSGVGDTTGTALVEVYEID